MPALLDDHTAAGKANRGSLLAADTGFRLSALGSLQTVSDGLYADREEADVADLNRALGELPDWAIVADISGRASAESLMPLLAAVLGHGGVALDDNSNVPWSVPEIQLGKDAGRP